MSMFITEYSKVVKSMLKCDVVICTAIYLFMMPGRCHPRKFFLKGIETTDLT